MSHFRGPASVVPVLVLAAAAFPGTIVHEVRAGADSVAGEISSASEVDRVPIRLVEGSLFGLTLRAAKGGLLRPGLVLLGVDRRPDPASAAVLKTSRRGDAVSLSLFPVAETGLHYLEIRGAGGTTGGWTLTTKMKFPRGAAGAAQSPTAGAHAAFEFIAPGNATATLKAAAIRGGTGIPSFVSLLDPDGAAVPLDDLVPGSAGFTAYGVPLARPGRYVLTVDPGTGAAGPFGVKVRWRIPKATRRGLLDTEVITDPVPTAITPDSGFTSDRFPATVAVDFARPGALVRFRREPVVVAIPASGVAADDASAVFQLNLASFQKGVYDVEVENPDGGKGTLEDAFQVANAPALPVSVAPAFGFDNQVITLTVTGSFLMSGAAVALERGGNAIPGTYLSGSGSQLQARFDLRDRAIGAWELAVTNPDTAAARLPGAFEIRNAPPVVASITPGSNLSSAVVSCTIAGTDFDATPRATLRMAGQPGLAANSVLWISAEEVRASFDTTGSAQGTWDLEMTNPDAQSSTLAGAFRTRGTVGPVAKVVTPGGSADGPPASAYDASRNVFLLGWVDAGGTGTDVWVQRIGSTGSAIGSRVSVSSAAGGVPKKDVSVGWDSTNDQYLVTWSETRALSVGSSHPSYGYNGTGVHEVFAQRLQASDLSALGGNVQVTDHTYHSGYYIDEFNNFRSSAAWDARQKVWRIIWMQEWDASGRYSTDDYDVFFRSLDPANGTSPLGTLGWGAMTGLHEGDPSAAWDPVGQQVLYAYSTRPGASSRLEVRLGVGSSSTVVASDSSADLVDPRLAVDPSSKRVLLSWTRKPASGLRTVEAALFDEAALSSRIGNVLTVGTGTGEEHFLAHPLYCGALGEGLLAWTRIDGSGGLSVRFRHLDTSASGGLAFSGPEGEVSGGSRDEGASTVVPSSQAGECLFFWIKTLTLSTTGSYPGSVVNGTYRGKEIWMQRYR